MPPRKPPAEEEDWEELPLATSAFMQAVGLAVEAADAARAAGKEVRLPRKEMLALLGLRSNKRFDEIVATKEFSEAMAYWRMDRLATSLPQRYGAWACLKEAAGSLSRMIVFKIKQQELGLLPERECLTLKELMNHAPKITALLESAEAQLQRELAAVEGEDYSIEAMTARALASIEDPADQERTVTNLSRHLSGIVAGLLPAPSNDPAAEAAAILAEIEID